MDVDPSTRGGPAPWRVVAAIAATYVFFLLFAQFGLLATLRQELADPRGVEMAMAVMGVAGLAGSLLTGAFLRRLAPRRAVPAGLLACAIVALSAPAAHGLPALLLISGLTGLAASFLTVSLAAGLRVWLPVPRFGLHIGIGTGLAYAICNIPSLFESSPAVRSIIPGLLCAVAGLVFLREGGAPPEAKASATGGLSWADVGARGVAGVVLAFVGLIFLDSAAFAIIEQNPMLDVFAWGRGNGRIVPGLIHALAAVAGGWLIDRARFRGVLVIAYALFVLALGAITRDQHFGGWLYVAAVSLYSTALVAYPGLRGDGIAPRWRAALVYGIGGWLGSALGVGLAQQMDHIPLSAVLAAGALLVVGALLRLRGAASALAGPGAGALLGLLVLGPSREGPPASVDLAARGRAVYVREGCINCHSQFVRPQPRDEQWWGPARGYDRTEAPPLIGNRRQGPDLQNVGNRRFANWNALHLQQPDVVSPGSRMPSYAHLFTAGNTDGDALVAYLSSLGTTTLVQRIAAQDGARCPDKLAGGTARRGRRIFAARCTGCHGKEGRGDGLLADRLPWPALNLRKGPLLLGGQPADPARVARVIKFGWTGTPMAGHEYLTDADLADVTAYVLALSGPSR